MPLTLLGYLVYKFTDCLDKLGRWRDEVLSLDKGKLEIESFPMGLLMSFHRTSGVANDKSIGLKTSFSWDN